MKINLSLASVFLSAIAIGITLYFRGQTIQIVYVDSVRLLSNYSGAKAAKDAYERKAGIYKVNLDTLRAEVEARVYEYEHTKAKAGAKEKSLMEELLRVKQQEFMNYQQAIKEKMQQEDQEISSKVMEKVNDYIRRFGKKKGYKIILTATQYGNIAYAEEGLDVTEEVLQGLNTEFIK